MKIYDVSRPIYAGMPVYPGDPEPHTRLDKDMSRGDLYNLTVVDMSVHTATHADAPRHFIADGAAIDELPPERFFGRTRVADATGHAVITREILSAIDPKRGERLLLKTDNSSESPPETEVRLDLGASELLAERGVMTIGIDGLSVGDPPKLTHDAILGADIAVIEGLDLSGIEPGEYLLSALPIKIRGAEGAPLRALLAETE